MNENKKNLVINKDVYTGDVELGSQKVFTPVFDLENVAGNVFLKEVEKYNDICIMYNPEFLEYFLMKGLTDKKYTFVFDSHKKYIYTKIVEQFYNLKNSINYIDIRDAVVNGKKNNPNRFDNIMAKKHFDVVFTNPPYNDGLDLKLIKMMIDNDIADEIVCVHPAGFLFNHNDNREIEELKDTNTLKEINLFWGNTIFDGTEVRHAHCISIWNKNHNSPIVTVNDKAFTEIKSVYNVNSFTYNTDVHEITIHSILSKKAYEFMKKFEKCDSILDHIVNINDTNKKTKYGFKCPTLRAGFNYANRNYGMFYSFFGAGNKAMENALIDEKATLSDFMMIHEGYNKNYPMWYFGTKKELDNFIKYLKTKSARFLLSLIKHSSELNTTKFTRIIPWMDFTKEWTDEKLIKEFGIDEELWDYIDKFIPDYYEDYRTTARGNI